MDLSVSKSLSILFKKNLTKKVVVKVFDRSPRSDVASSTFGNEGMDMRIPFQVEIESMKDADKSRSKVFRFIHLGKHAKNNVSDGMK